MRDIQSLIINELGVKSTINSKLEIRKRIDFLKNYCKKSNSKGFVLGISGGQDSTLAGKLAQLAVIELRQEGYNASFVAIRLPYGIQQDEEDANLALEFIQADKVINFNIFTSVLSFSEEYSLSTGENLSDFHKGNVKARMRMIAQYAISGENGLLVIGTDHAAEAITGFFTKYGDGGADILPLSGLSKRQGTSLLKELQTPERLYLKKPTADLLDNSPQQSDETELGITYEQIDDYLEGKEVSEEVASKLENRYLITKHKRNLPSSPLDDWWK